MVCLGAIDLLKLLLVFDEGSLEDPSTIPTHRILFRHMCELAQVYKHGLCFIAFGVRNEFI